MSQSSLKSIRDKIHGELEGKYLFGCGWLLDLLLIAYFARGHVLIEGPPGTAKTLTAKLLARVLAKSFKRIQFTTDLLPQDIIGAHIFSPAKQSFEFIKGPLFSDFVLADEINRTPPRTQSALLEAMEEKQVSVEGVRHQLSPDFFVVATQNPQDHEGTFPLPENELDRFLFKVTLSHWPQETEKAVLAGIVDGTLPPDLSRIPQVSLDRDHIDAEIAAVRTDDSILTYITQILDATRRHPMLEMGSSVRGGIALVRCARIRAILQNRDFVVPDDIKELAVSALRQRVRPNPEAQISQVSEEQIITDILGSVEFPR